MIIYYVLWNLIMSSLWWRSSKIASASVSVIPLWSFCCKTLPYFGIIFQEFFPLKPQQCDHGSLPWNFPLELCPRCYMSFLFWTEFQSFHADVVCRWCSQQQERPPPYKPSVCNQAGALICGEDRPVVMRSTFRGQTDPADLPRCTSERVRDSFCHISCFSFCVF